MRLLHFVRNDDLGCQLIRNIGYIKIGWVEKVNLFPYNGFYTFF